MESGDLIDGRFTLLERRAYDLPGVERFLARDQRLRKRVVVDVVTSLAPTAVRRSALASMTVRDPRIARTIAVVAPPGDDTAIVTEEAVGVPLSSLLGQRRLGEAQARAVVGEATRALAAAAAGQVHHGWVRPEVISVDARGRVMIAGLATDGALALQAAVRRGKGEAADATALAAVFLTCVTGKDSGTATAADLPPDLSEGSQKLCEAALEGNTLHAFGEVLDALGAFDTRVLRGLPANVDALPLPVAYAADEAKRKRRERAAMARRKLVATPASGIAIAPETLERAEVAATGSIPIVLPEAEPLEDLHDMYTLDAIVDEQVAKAKPTTSELFWARMHRQWPQSERVSRRLQRAHHRAINGGPIPSMPIVLTLVAGGLVVAAMLAFSWMTADTNQPPTAEDPLSHYPDFTFGP